MRCPDMRFFQSCDTPGDDCVARSPDFSLRRFSCESANARLIDVFGEVAIVEAFRFVIRRFHNSSAWIGFSYFRVLGALPGWR